MSHPAGEPPHHTYVVGGGCATRLALAQLPRHELDGRHADRRRELLQGYARPLPDVPPAAGPDELERIGEKGFLGHVVDRTWPR